MLPYGYNYPSFQGGFGGQPPYPPMGPPAMAYSVPQPFAQAPGGGRGRGRGRGGYANTPRTRSLVPQIKEEARMATGGQLLELTRYFAATLSKTDATLYGQFLTGLGRGVAVQDHSTTSPDTSVSRMIVADRKKKWKELCAADDDAVFWQTTVDHIKKEHGASASVDELVLSDEKVDVRRYQLGRLRREALLTEAGLTREGTGLRPIDSDGSTSDGGFDPNHSSGEHKHKGHPKKHMSAHIEEVANEDANPQTPTMVSQLNALTGLVSQLVHRSNNQASQQGSWAYPGVLPYSGFAQPYGYAPADHGHPHGSPLPPHGSTMPSSAQAVEDKGSKGTTSKADVKPEEEVSSASSSPSSAVPLSKPPVKVQTKTGKS
jgi:hypothetical protein